MTQDFFCRLKETAKERASRLIVGIDPVIEKFPIQLTNQPITLSEKILQYNQCIIDATKEFAIAYKPQVAFHEQYGIEGLIALQRTLQYLKENQILSIIDAKRNDIGHTAQAYANAWLKKDAPFQADSITLNGYLGFDGIQPFLESNTSAGLFILVKTSNQSSSELQDLILENKNAVFDEMALLVQEWNKKEPRFGIVVGATHLKLISTLRKLVPELPFLMPGIGAQKGSIDAVKEADPHRQYLSFAPISRSIYFPLKQTDFQENNWKNNLFQSAKEQARYYQLQIENSF